MIKHRNKLQPRKKSLQVLQMPIALFSWGIVSYIIELAILVLRPLWTSGWVRESWVRQNSFSCQGLMLIGGIDCHWWVGVRNSKCRGLYLDCINDIRTTSTRSSSAKQHVVSMIFSDRSVGLCRRYTSGTCLPPFITTIASQATSLSWRTLRICLTHISMKTFTMTLTIYRSTDDQKFERCPSYLRYQCCVRRTLYHHVCLGTCIDRL